MASTKGCRYPCQPFISQRRASWSAWPVRRQTARLWIASAVNSGTQDSTDVKKARLYDLVGVKNGLDRSPKQRAEIEELLAEIEAVQPMPMHTELRGSSWQLVYTSSTGNSSGKLGPFIGRTGQVFPVDAPGKYINTSDFGWLRTELRGRYKVAGETRINLEFEDVTFIVLGGLARFSRPFATDPPFRGHWVMRYADDALRVLDSNQGNVFVLRRVG